MNLIKSVFKQVLPRSWRRKLRKLRDDRLDVYAFKSYSQEGEDMILRRLFEWQKQGFYVDVGAHHPRRFSNTYFFYQRGWRGLNIDAMPGSMRLFAKLRPRDINVESAVGAGGSPATYYVFNDPALNSFDASLARERNTGPYHIVRELEVPVVPLKHLLDKHLPPGQRIDFLTIDVEGMELEVLQSNDWSLFRPKYVLVECLNVDFTQLTQNAVFYFVSKQGYYPAAKTLNTALFCDVYAHGHPGSP